MKTSAYSYIVAPGCTVVCPDNTTRLRAGDKLDHMRHGFTDKWIADHLRSGHIKIETQEVPLGPGASFEQPGRNVEAPSVPSDQVKDKGIDTTIKASTRVDPKTPVVNITQPPKPVSNAKTAPSLWVLDPATLQGKSLEQLNVMVAERDANVHPFTTLQEASAFLSQHFGVKV